MGDDAISDSGLKTMCEVYLFDWGDTLMVDTPGQCGKMCEWPEVAAVEGAEATLRHLSRSAQLYIATGAADSSAADIEAAFERVGLARYLSGYFCKANLGIDKGVPAFLPAILQRLSKKPQEVTMVGDSFDKDIRPALALGIHAVWLRRQKEIGYPPQLRIIRHLQELCLPL